MFYEFSRKKPNHWLFWFLPIEQAVKEGQLQFKPTTEGVLGKPVDLPSKYRYVNKSWNFDFT